ncbi:hypothetical protein L0337_33160 [candidate division KSB1 bacterium]|nr:hypothetical protein [candidate division KSB1 bacterium]
MKQTIILAFVVTALILAYVGGDGNIFALQQNKVEQELIQFKDRQVLWTDIFIKKDGRWQCVASQGTLVAAQQK